MKAFYEKNLSELCYESRRFWWFLATDDVWESVWPGPGLGGLKIMVNEDSQERAATPERWTQAVPKCSSIHCLLNSSCSMLPCTCGLRIWCLFSFHMGIILRMSHRTVKY